MKVKFREFLPVIAIFTLAIIPAGPALSEESYTFYGRGTAHGVGLDMAGAKALAEQGRGYQQILTTYYSGIAFTGGRENESLRVGLLNSGDLQVTADSAYYVYVNNGAPGAHAARVDAGKITHVRHEGGQYRTSVDNGGSWAANEHTWFAPEPGGRLKVVNSGRRYRGNIEARRAAGSGLLWAINVINLEDYVKGIAEEPNDWPTEGQRTLAVAARTYALNKKLYSTKWDSENFDIDATMGSQYYLGYDAERSNLVLAADFTRGVVMTYGDRVIVAAYHGNSGGYTESLENVWGGSADDYPYLRSVPSPWTPAYRWGPMTFSKSRLQEIFNSHPESRIGTLYSIDLRDRTPSGRVRKVRLSGSNGLKDIWGYSQFAGWLGLPSSKISLDGANDHYDEYILLLNTGAQEANAKLTFMFPGGGRQVVNKTVRADSRVTVIVDGLIRAGANSVKVQSDAPIVAERSLYFDYNGYDGGSNSLGSKAPSRRWYFAEGRTGADYDNWLLVQNPRNVAARVTATFMPGRGRRVRKTIVVGPHARGQIHVDTISGLRAVPTPAVVRSTVPVIAERSTYFNNNGLIGGHSSRGAPSLATAWYFAEGYTGAGFISRLQIFNPNDAPTTATVTLSKNNGDQVVRRVSLPARYRRSILLNRLVSGDEFGISVTAGAGVVAERTIYFNFDGKVGGSGSVGSPNISRTWYFAEGSTRPGFDEFLTILNPGAGRANVAVDYVAEGGGATIRRVHAVGPGTRKTVPISGTEEVGPGRSVGMKITSDEPIMAERVMYFNYAANEGRSTWTGGHASLGAVSPSRTWLFAEGITE